MLSGWRWCIWGHDLEVEVKVETRPPWWELISASWPLSRTREGWGYLLPSRVPSRSWIKTVNRNENKQINCFIPLTPDLFNSNSGNNRPDSIQTREGTPRRHEPPLFRHEPPRLARQTKPPLCSNEPSPCRPSLRYAVDEPLLYRTVF